MNQAKSSKTHTKTSKKKNEWIFAVHWHEQCCHDASVPSIETQSDFGILCIRPETISIAGRVCDGGIYCTNEFLSNNGQWRKKQNSVEWNACAHTALNLPAIRTYEPEFKCERIHRNNNIVFSRLHFIGQYVYPLVLLPFKSSRSTFVAWTWTKKTITACLNGKQQHNFQIYSIHFIVSFIIVFWYVRVSYIYIDFPLTHYESRPFTGHRLVVRTSAQRMCLIG